MRGVIKGMLAEELKNSLKMQKGYEAALKRLPAGCLSRKMINGKAYYYLVKRKGPKVVYSYVGSLSPDEVRKYDDNGKKKARYRQLLSRVKKQSKYLKGVLRGKEPV
jgi:hypothetical protein